MKASPIPQNSTSAFLANRNKVIATFYAQCPSSLSFQMQAISTSRMARWYCLIVALVTFGTTVGQGESVKRTLQLSSVQKRYPLCLNVLQRFTRVICNTPMNRETWRPNIQLPINLDCHRSGPVVNVLICKQFYRSTHNHKQLDFFFCQTSVGHCRFKVTSTWLTSGIYPS